MTDQQSYRYALFHHDILVFADDILSRTIVSKSSLLTTVCSLLGRDRLISFPFQFSLCITQTIHHPHHAYPSPTTLSVGSMASALQSVLSSIKAQNHVLLLLGILSRSSFVEKVMILGHQISTTSSCTPFNRTHSIPLKNPRLRNPRLRKETHTTSLPTSFLRV